MYVAVILRSDKTTVSIAMGDTEYHPVYLSIGGLHNGVRCAHQNALVPIAFLAIPKSKSLYTSNYSHLRFMALGDRWHDNDPAF